MIRTDEHTTTLISVMGMTRCDIPYYMGRLINAASKTVLLIDNSAEKGLFDSIPKPEEETEAQIGDMTFLSDIGYSEHFFSQYDYVIIYHGMNMNQPLCENSDLRYIVTDFNPFATIRIKHKIASSLSRNLDYYLVLRDKISAKISNKTIIEELGLKETNIIECHEISYSDADYMCYMNLVRNGSQQIKATSPEMRDFLKAYLYHLLPNTQPKEIQKIFKSGINGKIR